MSTCRIVLVLSTLAHAWTWGVGLFHVFNPNAHSGTSTQSGLNPDGKTTTTVTGLSSSLIEVNGLQAVLALLAPILVSGLFLAVAVSNPGGRAMTITLLWVTTVVMLGFCVLGAASIGIGYAPGALAMLAAALAGQMVGFEVTPTRGHTDPM
ncbi:MAG: hypothetical protein OXN92_13570 [Gammaproteobacteria bacterium]|nr:hypothetical protein [Gammaproteobacteria bacterium]